MDEDELKFCPQCGAVMCPESEYMDTDHRYEMIWWECPECGCCIER